MKLICYLHPGWRPLIRPAPIRRPWMDHTPESFAYRCLPLNIANAHGWEILSPYKIEACWNGDRDVNGVVLRHAAKDRKNFAVSLFGQGILTFHIEGIFRTAPGWNLWVGGSPNRPKDGISPLTAIVETDWSPFTFTMNWLFTRPHSWISFEREEPICMIFPVRRDALDTVAPTFAPIEAEVGLLERFSAWSEARDDFIKKQPLLPEAARWQKHYYQGVDLSGTSPVQDHKTKLRLPAFDTSQIAWEPRAGDDTVAGPDENAKANDENTERTERPIDDSSDKRLQKREWLLETLERQRAVSPAAIGIERRMDLSKEEFLDCYYATNRPVILVGEMTNWPALTRWTPEYLKQAIGSKLIEFQGDRIGNARFEVEMESHRRELPFDQFIDLVSGLGIEKGNDAYLTAYNSAKNTNVLSVLHSDLGFLDKYLSREADRPNGMMWIGAAGTFTPLHHDLTNNFIAQLVGRKRLIIAPASEIGKLCNDFHVYSRLSDLENPQGGLSDFRRLHDLCTYQVTLAPGEIIFMPLAWWHQVKSIDFSVTITYTNFLWRNDFFKTYPG